jgi:hypothetical protein
MASFIDPAVNPTSMLPPPPVIRSPRRPLSIRDWEEQRATIERLYSAGGLHEVMKAMEQDYGFLATYAFPCSQASLRDLIRLKKI